MKKFTHIHIETRGKAISIDTNRMRNLDYSEFELRLSDMKQIFADIYLVTKDKIENPKTDMSEYAERYQRLMMNEDNELVIDIASNRKRLKLIEALGKKWIEAHRE